MAFLGEWRTKARMIYSETPSKIVTPLATIAPKKASAIWQEEFFWTAIRLSTLQAQDIYYYYGCEICGKCAFGGPGTKFDCNTCSKKNATVESRLVMTCDLTDASGTLKVTAYTTETEKLINLKADDFCALKKEGDAAIKDKFVELKDKQLLVKICPRHELSITNVLKWVVVAVKPIPNTEKVITDSPDAPKVTEKHKEAADSNTKEDTTNSAVRANENTIDKNANTQADTQKAIYAQTGFDEGTSKRVKLEHVQESYTNISDEETLNEEVWAAKSQYPES